MRNRIPYYAGVLSFLMASIHAQANVVLDWNAAALEAIRVTRANPPAASRALACTHAAIHDAVNGIRRAYEQCFVANGAEASRIAPMTASVEVAASAAAYRTLSALFPTRAADFEALHQSILAGVPDGTRKTGGLTWGTQCAGVILSHRADDGASAVVIPPVSTGPGDWVPTPPAFAAYLLPQWGYVTPFALLSPDQFRAPPPPALDSPYWTEDYNLTKEYGGLVSTLRTPDQSQIALFWADGAGTETPPGHWNHIASDLARQQGLSIETSARLLALLNLALADAAICAWDAKYAYNWWRPYTAIRAGDLDGNDDTVVDASWTPLIVTPPFPEHTSGHSTFSGAASRVLARFFGSDDIPFTSQSDFLPGVVRSFPSFSAAAQEAGMSRIYGGIHFMSANVGGLEAGTAIGDWVFDGYLRPRRILGRF